MTQATANFCALGTGFLLLQVLSFLCGYIAHKLRSERQQSRAHHRRREWLHNDPRALHTGN